MRKFFTTQHRYFPLLFSLVLMPAAVALTAYLTHSVMGEGPDSRLYLSIADNFLSTGHFIQTARKGGYVVPFGTPLILTVLRFFRFSLPMVVAFQHVLLGGTCCFLCRTEQNLGGRGYIAPMMFILSLLRTRILYDTIYVECYYLFCLSAILWLLTAPDLTEKKRLIWLNVAGFAAFAIRTVLLIVYLPILVWTVWRALRGHFPLRNVLPCLLIPVLLMGLNTWNNHRETGYWIITDNYSGSDLYLANNPATKAEYFTTSTMYDFTIDEYKEIDKDKTLNFTQKNQKFADRARQWIRENPGTFVKNVLLRFYRIFVLYWRYLMLLGFLCGVYYCAAASRHRTLSIVCLLLNLLLGLATCVCNIMGRYTLPLWPLTAVHMAAGTHALAEAVFRRRKKATEA